MIGSKLAQLRRPVLGESAVVTLVNKVGKFDGDVLHSLDALHHHLLFDQHFSADSGGEPLGDCRVDDRIHRFPIELSANVFQIGVLDFEPCQGSDDIGESTQVQVRGADKLGTGLDCVFVGAVTDRGPSSGPFAGSDEQLGADAAEKSETGAGDQKPEILHPFMISCRRWAHRRTCMGG